MATLTPTAAPAAVTSGDVLTAGAAGRAASASATRRSAQWEPHAFSGKVRVELETGGGFGEHGQALAKLPGFMVRLQCALADAELLLPCNIGWQPNAPAVLKEVDDLIECHIHFAINVNISEDDPPPTYDKAVLVVSTRTVCVHGEEGRD